MAFFYYRSAKSFRFFREYSKEDGKIWKRDFEMRPGAIKFTLFRDIRNIHFKVTVKMIGSSSNLVECSFNLCIKSNRLSNVFIRIYLDYLLSSSKNLRSIICPLKKGTFELDERKPDVWLKNSEKYIPSFMKLGAAIWRFSS